MEGILCTIWDDRSPHFETIWRGIYDFSSFSWNNSDVPVEKVNEMFRHRFYSPLLSDSTFEFQNELEKALPFWETSLVNKSRRSSYPQNIDLIDLPNPLKSGEWSETNKQRIEQANFEILRYKNIMQKIDYCFKNAMRNRYSLSVMKQINELQIYPSKLLLLLDRYDKETNLSDKENIRKEVQQYITCGFKVLRQQFEEVYSETRFLKNPDDYKLDQIHHLANGTNNSDWMFVFELAMNEKIKKWLNIN